MMQRSSRRVLIACYTALWLLLLWFILKNDDGSPDSGISIALGYGALILSFPIGFAALALVGGLAMAVYELTGYSILGQGQTNLVVTWAIFMAAGLFQWVVLIPAIRRWWARKRTSNNTVETDARKSGARGSP